MKYEVYLDTEILYYPGDEVNVVSSAALQTKLNQAGSFKIVVPPVNPCFDSFKQRQSEVRILKNGTEIWNGEVLNIGGNIKNQKSVYVVGELSYLNASSQPQKKYEYTTPLEMLTILLEEHNSMVEPRKQFKVGIVTVSKEHFTWTTNYEGTLDYIRAEMCEKLNGYLRIRKVDGIRYLDLVKLEDYGKRCSQSIEFGENLLDFTSDITADSIATVIRPLGARLETGNIEGMDSYLTIESVNDGKDYLENTEAIDSGMGKIWKTVHFNVLTDAAAVKTAGGNWLKDRQFANLNITATAIDLSVLGADIESFELGDAVHVYATPFGMDKWSYITEKDLDLLKPSVKHNITIGEAVRKTYTKQMIDAQEEIKKELPQQSALLNLAKLNASELIKNASAGNIHAVYDENGKPIELCIMDTNDITTAQKVWRWNMGGFGYSSTGYNGEYGTAITMDGAIVADFITTGILNAALIKAGILSDKTGKTYWNLESGEFAMSSSTKIGSSTVASVQNVADAKDSAYLYADDAADNAKNEANADTDGKLVNYSTTTEMNVAISASAEKATVSFDKKIDETKIYADDAANTAQTNANNSMDNKLKLYSTTTEMQTAINTSAEALTVDFNKKITDTEVYAQNVAAAAEDNANAATEEKLKSYSTITEMNSAISASAESVRSEMSKSVTTLQQQIDGAIETFTGSAVPTLSNEPASTWITDAIKDTHIGDLYMVNSDGGDYAGFYYRFEKTGSVYQWTLLKDSEITKALQDAKEANEKAQKVADDLSEKYSTTTQMNSAIEQKAEEIRSEVTRVESALNGKNYLVDSMDVRELAGGSTLYELSEAVENETVTLFVTGKATKNATASIAISYYLSSGQILDRSENITLTNEESRQSKTLYLTSIAETTKIRLYASASNACSIWDVALRNTDEEYAAIEEMRSAIRQTADAIELEVSKKIDADEVVSSVNVSTEGIELKGNRISIESDKFALAKDGSATFTSDSDVWLPPTSDDVDRIKNVALGYETVSGDLLKAMDFNCDGKVNITDYTAAKAILLGKTDVEYYVTTFGYEKQTSTVTLKIQADDSEKTIVISGTNSFGTEVECCIGAIAFNANQLRAEGANIGKVYCGEISTAAGNDLDDIATRLVALEEKTSNL